MEYAAGKEERPTRRGFLRNGGLAIGTALFASGATANLMSRTPTNKPSNEQTTSQDAHVPEPSVLLMVGGALLSLAAIQKQRARRGEDPNALEATRHLSGTEANILVMADRQMKSALAASAERPKDGPAR